MLEERIEEMEDILKEKTKITDEAKWLMSIPGIGYHNALLILSELGEIERFSNPKSMVSYSGLAPKVEQSGNYTRYGLWDSAPCGVPPHHPENPVRVYRKPCKGLTMCRKRKRHKEMNVEMYGFTKKERRGA